MRTILPIYLTASVSMAGLGLTDNDSGSVMSWFKMGCYMLPLLGGFLADRYFGKYWTIVGFSIPYVIGHFLLAIPHWTMVVIALVLLAAGSGVIKPNISALLGQTYDQQRPGQERLRSAAFMWYYLAINIGALLATLALPELNRRLGFAGAFQFPTWLMVLALVIFAAGKPLYATEEIDRTPPTPAERRARWETLGRLYGIFGLMIFFWIGYEQNDNMWVFFIRDYVDLRVSLLSAPVPPEQLQFINPLFVLLLIPLFNGLFRWFDPQMKIFTPIRKILVGFILGAAASGMMALAGLLAETSATKVSILWPALAYVLLTAGEVLLYGTGLELSYAIAPKNMKGFVTACFLMTAAVANFVNSYFVRLYGGSLKDAIEVRGPLAPSVFFGITALIVLAAAVAFFFVGRRFDANSANRATAS
ncbi:MAG: MFS transporter [Planctomycetes bacterium]|nr:MFS transporter [Planctomycetota bacterium]